MAPCCHHPLPEMRREPRTWGAALPSESPLGLQPRLALPLTSRPYLGDAGVQHGAEEGLAVVGADGGRQEGQQVVLKEALTEKLVKKPAGVEGAQRASEPGVLDGNVHGGAAGSQAGGDSGGASGQRAGQLGSWGAGPAYIRLGQNAGIRGFIRKACAHEGGCPVSRNVARAEHLPLPAPSTDRHGAMDAKSTAAPRSIPLRGSVPTRLGESEDSCPKCCVQGWGQLSANVVICDPTVSLPVGTHTHTTGKETEAQRLGRWSPNRTA